MTKDCIGCESIEQGIFPFTKRGGYKIDSEGCMESGPTEIYFCPVCGVRLTNS